MNWNTLSSSRSTRRAPALRCCAMRWAGARRFFVDSLNKLNLTAPEADGSLPLPEGVLGRLDRLVDFREPLGPAAKHFLTKLRTAYIAENSEIAQQLANENPHSYYLTHRKAPAITGEWFRADAQAKRARSH